MNIAHLLPYTAQFPLAKHNGRYEWALRLARLQAADGHTVTMYSAPGSGDGITDLTWRSIAFEYKQKPVNNIALIKFALQEKQHDIYHSHFDYLHYFLADSIDKPIIFTQHWFPNQEIGSAVKFNTKKSVVAVPATQLMAQENDRLGIPSTGITRQGIDLELFKYTAEPATDRFIFVGRITPNKGVLEAVKLALGANQKLDIVGKINETDESYWKQIEPLVDGNQIKYLGAKTHIEVAGLLANAKALIFPSQAPEASPQVPIESQACGTPVIISNVGSTMEWVDQGKTGFIASSDAEYKYAIDNIGSINRSDCRSFAMQFSIEAMASNYYKAYESLLDKTF